MVALFTRSSDIDDDSICHDPISLFARPPLRSRIYIRSYRSHVHAGFIWLGAPISKNLADVRIDHPPRRFSTARKPFRSVSRTKLMVNFKKIPGSKDMNENYEEIGNYPSKISIQSR